MTKPKRLYIYPKDICRITGKSISTARRMIKSIKAEIGRNNSGHLTVIEFCDSQGLKVEDVNLYL